ncbi:hypothetical protein [Pseudokineococcus sp. 1T1Z-3]|uniref:hypothetical protein n=1 Tax=Pseudokineococcus sp. 1T1Z-3 TaxID=3132745 RepID=UPI0030ABBA62
MTASLPSAVVSTSAAAPRRRLGVVASLAVLWSLLLLFVVDPRATVTTDLAALYSPDVGGWWPVLPYVVVLAAAGVGAWLLAMKLATLAVPLPAAPRRLVGVACACGEVAAVTMVTTLLFFPVGLGLYSRAETLGIAPPAGSLSRAAELTTLAGLVALGGAVVLGACTAVLASRAPGQRT